jgi:hypothetical protein
MKKKLNINFQSVNMHRVLSNLSIKKKKKKKKLKMEEENFTPAVTAAYNTQFPSRNFKNTFMNVLSLNIQSIRNKLMDFTTFIQNSRITFHVIVLSETHLRENETVFFNIPEYNAEHSVRKSSRFGGVSIYVRKDFSSFNVVHKLDFNMNNSILIHLLKHNIHIAGFYRCRDSNLDQFLSHLDYVLDNFSNLYAFGDFNLDLCKAHSDNNVKKYQEIVTSNGFNFLNNPVMPTRIDERRGTATCIDHVITDNMFQSHKNSVVISLDEHFADHKSILLSIITKTDRKAQQNSFYTIKKVDHAKIISQNLLAQVHHNTFENFQLSLSRVISQNTRHIQYKERFKKTFMNSEALCFIQIRSNYFKLKKKYPNSCMARERYIYYRNLVNRMIMQLKKSFYHKQFLECKDNPRETWRNINNLLRNCDSKIDSDSFHIKLNGQNVTNKATIAENFNSYFVSAADDIHAKIQLDFDVYRNLHDFENYRIIYPFECELTTREEILQIISTFSNSSAEDANGFSNNIFKKYRTYLCDQLEKLINTCILQSDFPNCLKRSKVVPLFKNGDKTCISNFRPITLCAIEGKVFEGVILKRILKHLTLNEILCPQQFGYTKKSSCETAVLHLMNRIYSNLEQKLHTAVMFIDLSKAFDSIFHQLLLIKIQKMGFSDSFVDLIRSYLAQRTQFVVLDKISSSEKRVTRGVFQGSTLGATLFNIYVNSIFNLPLHGKTILYADDIAISYGASSKEELKSWMEYDLKVLDIWFNNHFMAMNAKKTCYIYFNGKKVLDNFVTTGLDIQLNSQRIERVDSFKYLGFWIDEKLNFQKHVNQIKSKIIPITFAIKRIRNFISEKTALQLYFSHVNSHLIYMNTFWSAAHKNVLHPISIIQKKCLRFVFKKYSYSPSRELFTMNILPLQYIIKYNIILTAFKLTKGYMVNNIEISVVGDRHRYPTRQSDQIFIQNYRTRFGSSNFTTRGFAEYNGLSNRLKNIQHIGRFKRELKRQLYEEFLDGTED